MTVYSQKACKPCVTLKYWLNNKQINDYNEEPIENHIDELREKGFWSAPVVKIGDRYFNGSDLSTLAQHLGV